MPGSELLEELVAAVGDRGSEERAVCELEREDRLGVVGSERLQLGHRSTLPVVAS